MRWTVLLLAILGLASLRLLNNFVRARLLNDAAAGVPVDRFAPAGGLRGLGL